MATYTIHFHGVASVEAETEEEAKRLFYNDEGDYSEYTIDSCEEDDCASEIDQYSL